MNLGLKHLAGVAGERRQTARGCQFILQHALFHAIDSHSQGLIDIIEVRRVTRHEHVV